MPSTDKYFAEKKLDKPKDWRSGQSLIELLVGLSIGAIIIGGAAGAVSVYLRSNLESKKQQTSTFLAQELMDNVRVFAEGNWHNIYDLSKGSSNHYYLVTTASPFTTSTGDQSITAENTTFTRYFYVDNVSRDSSSGDIQTTYTTSTDDTSTQKITVKVTWPSGGSITQSEYITRSRSFVFQQTDWSGGSGQETFASTSTINNQFASSSNLLYSTAGQLSLTGLPPYQITDLAATAGSAQVSLTWSAPSDGGSTILYYRIYRSLSTGAESLLATTTSAGYTDTGLTNETTYYYQVSAVNAIDEGTISSEVSVTPSEPGGILWATSSSPSPGSASLQSITRDASYIYLAGYDNIPGNAEVRLEKRNISDGSLVWATTTDYTSSSEGDRAYAISLDGNYIYIAGYDSPVVGPAWRIEKRNISNGGIDFVTSTVGYWPLDEGFGNITSDSSGYGNKGFRNNGPVWTSGKFGGGMSFDGVDDYIRVADSTSLLPSAEITMSFWANKSGLGVLATGDTILLSKGGNYFGTCYSGSNSAIFSLNTPTQLYSTSSIPCAATGEWHHYVGTYDGVNQKIYIDGVLVVTKADTGAIVDTTGDLNIGRYDGTSYNFNGLMDDVRIYNRALNSTEVSALYNATIPSTWQMSVNVGNSTDAANSIVATSSYVYVVGETLETASNLWHIEKRNASDGSINYATGTVGYWNFNDGRGIVASDNSGAGNRGTLTSGPTWTTSGKYGSAIVFDGIDDYVDITSTSTLNPVASTTVAAWVKTTDNGPNGTVVSKTTGCASTGYLIWINENGVASTRPSFFVGNVWLDATAAANVTDGAWHYIVGTYDGNVARIYVDGALNNSSTIGLKNLSSTTNLQIGESTTCGDPLAGTIDDVRIYNRALSATEISTLYNATGTPATWTLTERQSSSSSDTPEKVAVDGSYMYVVGSESSSGNLAWLIEKRAISDGSIVWSTSSNPSSSSDSANGVAIDSTYLYVVGYDYSAANPEWHIEKRAISDGSIVWSTSTSIGSGTDIANDVALDQTYLYVAGYYDSGGDEGWRIEKRSKSDGGVVWTQTINPNASYSDHANEIVSDGSSYLYVAGDGVNVNGYWRIEKRND